MAQASTFSKIRISLASPDEMRKWSHGEVKKPETINYRTLKPERDGLFCERIFGPVKDWECHCGRYKKVKYKGIVCERCGVEVTRSKVRRERMGHIELAAPVTHIWYLKGVPSPMSLLLDISPKLLEKVVYFGSYIITYVDRLRLNEEFPAIQQAVEDQIQEMERTGIEDPTLLASLPEPEEVLEVEEVPEVLLPLEEMERAPLVPEDEIEQEPLGEAEAPDIALEEGIEPEVADEEALLEEDILFEKSTILEPTRLEGKNLEDRIAELRAAVDRLQVIQKRELIAEDEWRNIQRVLEIASIRLNKDYTQLVKAGLGASAIRDLLAEIDLEELARELRTEIAQTQGPRRARAIKRLEVVDAFLKSKSRPEWMILEVITVIPPDLRPMVQLDGGRFATSDLNDLYRRIINRNNRLKKIIEIRAPESIINHEKRLLQEAVDALIDNSRRSRPVVGSNNRPLRSLSDMLKGKEGRFRKNLLGKRVDYSGRSVIVVGPHLKLHQCGLPKEMALELFKPFVMKKLVEKGIASTVKAAKRKMERAHREPAIWDALAEVIQDHPVLLNRAPTLHRLGIQAFEPILVDGKAIQLHPLVCVAFGADFDGDQMAVHVPLSATAQAEARLLMLSILNLFKPAFGEPISAPKQDMVLGLYYLTMMDQKGGKGAGLVFKDAGEAIRAYQAGYVSLHAPVKIRMRSEAGGYTYVETTVGRAILNQLLPEEESADGKPTIWVERTAERFLNKTMDSQAVADLVAQWYNEKGWQATVKLLDGLKDLGFQFATQSGISIAITDMEVPKERDLIIEETQKRVDQLNRAYQRGLITQGEREQQVLRSWTEAFDRVADAILRNVDQFNPVYMMTDSGARGSRKQVTQLSGMRGVMSDPFGRMIEDLPIKSNFHEGLSVPEYFISTHGQRKGLADTALRTADAGYLTRRLVDVAQDVIIREWDCGTTQGIYVSEIREPGEGEPIESLADRIRGRIALEDIYLPGEKEPIVRANEEISDEAALKIQEAGITRVGIRSPMTCEARRGICAMCYGRDVGRQKMAQVGMAVGIIAAQSIGEPGTQLTMRTFHTGGVAAQHITGVAGVKRKKQETLKELHEDARRGLLSLGEGGERERSKAIQAMLKVLEEEVRGLLRVVELVEARRPKGQAIITEYDGVVAEIVEQRGLPEVVIHSELSLDDPERLLGERLAEPIRQPDTPEGEEGEVIVPAGAEINERVLRILQELGYTKVKIRRSYLVPHRGAQRDPQTGKFISAGRVHVGQKLQAGDRLTEGPLDPQKILELQGVRGVQDYLVSEIQQVYKGQSVDINDKHIEIIVRQMLKKVKVIEPGDTDFLPGQIVDRFEFRDQNQRVEAQGGRPATAEPLLLGITEAGLSTDSFLSAASFQKTTKVLADAAIRGKEDQLIGLKENVIIGRLIPAGTGLSTYRQQQRARQNGEETRKARVAD